MGTSWRSGRAGQGRRVDVTIPDFVEHLHVTNDAGEERAGTPRIPYAKIKRKQRFFRVVDSESGILLLRDTRDEIRAAMRAGAANIAPEEAYLASMSLGQVTDASIGSWTDALTEDGVRYTTAPIRFTLNWRENVENTLYVFADVPAGTLCCPYAAEKKEAQAGIDLLERVLALIEEISASPDELVDRLSPSPWLREIVRGDFTGLDIDSLSRMERELAELRSSMVPTEEKLDFRSSLRARLEQDSAQG